MAKVPKYKSAAEKIRIDLNNDRIKARIVETNYNYPLPPFSANASAGCDYLVEESPNLHSSNAITEIPADFYSSTGVLEFFKDIGLFISNDSMLLSLIPPNISPDRVIPDVIV